MNGKEKSPQLPECRCFDDVVRYNGMTVSIDGWYEVEPVPGGKRLQAASIVLADGTRLIHSYRPVKELFCFINRRITVTGVVTVDSGQGPEVQQVMAPHIGIDTISLHPDEEPCGETPVRIPDLPFIEKKADIGKWHDRWVHVYGRLSGLDLRPHESLWANATLLLHDGTTLCFEWVSFSRWSPFVDSDVTVTLLLKPEREEKGALYFRAGRTAVCSGKTARCGMND
ncbi:MAG: hypothetical protein JW881_12080 [Spirochaetales bacterium]|nr:hypothetical protein [Spirochaetales bacterium]